MERFARLMQKARLEGYRLLLTYDPDEADEEWCVKLYPDRDESDYFYSYHTNLEQACHKLLDEIRSQNL
jgi:hypothetical protein